MDWPIPVISCMPILSLISDEKQSIGVFFIVMAFVLQILHGEMVEKIKNINFHFDLATTISEAFHK